MTPPTRRRHDDESEPPENSSGGDRAAERLDRLEGIVKRVVRRLFKDREAGEILQEPQVP